MERKDYLLEELSKEEKLYLRRIVMTARNKYIEKNYNYINNINVSTKDVFPIMEDSILDTVLERCQGEINSAVEFEKTLSNPNLYNVVKALSLREKEVLFYLYKKQKSINEISRILKIDRITVWRIRNRAQKKIAEKLVKGEY